MSATESHRDIAEIVIGPRFRKELGNIEGLAADIRAIGLLHSIVIHPDGRLIAGRRRLEACKHLGWTSVPVRVVDLDNIVHGEASENLQREPFLPSEIDAIRRALEPIEKEKAKERQVELGRSHGTPGGNFPQGGEGKTRDKIGAFAGVSGRQVEKIAAIVDAAESDPEKFGKLVETMDRTGKVDRVFKQLHIARSRQAYEARRERGGTVADLVALAASGLRAGAIAVDPPWPWETWGGETGKVRTSPDNHYSTMTLAEIKAFGAQYVTPLAATNCVLFMWATSPLLVLGAVSDVIRAWGFEPKAMGFNWIKTVSNGVDLHWGGGYWTRSNSEICVLATRGAPLRIGEDVHEVIMAPVGEHSVKPDEAYARIERLVNGPYLEAFARRPRPGWTTWGDELSDSTP